MAAQLSARDIMDFEMTQIIARPVTQLKLLASQQKAIIHSHTKVGTIQFSGIPVPGMMVASVRWQTHDAVVLRDETPSQNININFHLKGHMHTRFSGLKNPLDMYAGRHNLVCIPAGGDRHEMKGGDTLEMLHVTIDAAHFKSLIGADDHWSEQVLRNLEAGRPFAGMPGTGAITPAMQLLIHYIKNDAPTGPMRNLLQQSRLMELLALQLQQFADACKPIQKTLPAVDADKLYLLKQYIDTHFLDDLSLTQLSRFVLLNEFKVKTGFKQLYGNSVFGYVKSLRMDYALRLLRDNRMKVEEVAGILSYEYPHHFSAAFKKHFGFIPSAAV